jgi:hypothetical protein
MKKETDKEILRLAVVTLLISSIFYILNYFSEWIPADQVTLDVFLKIISTVSFKFVFPIFLIYLVLLGLTLKKGKRKNLEKGKEYFYALGIDLTFFILMFTATLCILVWTLVKFPKIPMWLIQLVIWSEIIGTAVYWTINRKK